MMVAVLMLLRTATLTPTTRKPRLRLARNKPFNGIDPGFPGLPPGDEGDDGRKKKKAGYRDDVAHLFTVWVTSPQHHRHCFLLQPPVNRITNSPAFLPIREKSAEYVVIPINSFAGSSLWDSMPMSRPGLSFSRLTLFEHLKKSKSYPA